MAEQDNNTPERRRFVRLDLTENVRALDKNGTDIGRVEKVGAGGLQIRLADNIPSTQYQLGAQVEITIVEPGNVRNDFKVEVRVRDGSLLGLQFLN